jgi:hypothetical protein
VNKRTKILLGIGVIAALVVGWQVAAFAVHDTGQFELDGNATNAAATPGDDWDNVCHQVLGTDCSTSANTNGATAVDWVAESNPNASIFTGGGSKDPNDLNQWAWKDAGGLPDKDNLLHSFAARYTGTSGTYAGDQLLFFGSDRLDNSGDAQQGFWFFQNKVELGNNSIGGGKGFTGVHSPGDLLIISDFSNGGTVSTIKVYEWDPTVSGNLKPLASSDSASCAKPGLADDSFCGIVNPTNGTTAPWPYTDKSGNHTYLQGEFYEGGLNLTDLNLGDRCFSSVASETRSSTSTTATLKDFTLGGFGNCETGVTTQQQGSATKSIGTGKIQVTDQATINVSGITNWSGNVQFSLKQSPNGTPVDIGGPVAVSNSTSTVSSPAATVTAAGNYCWSAKFTSSTTGVPNSVDNGANECFTVDPVTPTLTTNASGNVTLGNPITDTATLGGTATQPTNPPINTTNTGGAAAGGTITFKLYGPDDATCSNPAVFTSSAVPVSGNGTYPTASQAAVSFTPTAAGTYRWVATYSGNLPNTNTKAGACNDANENVEVTSVASSMTTAQSFIPNDSAEISAPQGGDLAGSVTFKAYESSDCSGTAILTESRPVSGTSPKTVSTTNTTVSTTAANISWLVDYDSTNTAQRDIPASCHETSNLTITNGGTISSP